MSIYDKASLVLIPSGTKTSKVYSQKPVNGDGDFTFSRSTAATRVNADGNIEKETSNLLLQSNTFDTTWTLNSASVTGGQSGYDGSSDAWKLQSNGGNYCRVNQSTSINSVVTNSIYAKAGNVNFIGATATSGSGSDVVIFNLSTGVVSSTTGSNVIDANIENIGSGWYRCSVPSAANSAGYALWYVSDSGSSGSSSGDYVFIQDAQQEYGLVARDYIETTTAAVEGGITDNVPRLDYTDSSCPALLLEPQRTNVLPHSEYVGASEWLKANTTTQDNVVTSPEGFVNAARIIETAVYGNHQIYDGFSATSGQAYTISFFAKQNGRDIGVGMASGIFGSNSTYFDLTNGVVLSTTSESASIEDYGNGWFRCSVTNTANSSGSAFVYILLSNNENFTYTGDGTSGAYIYGIQAEAGSYATSYIPTYGTSVTRNSETCEITSASNLIGQEQGSLYWDVDFIDNGGYPAIFVYDGTSNNRLLFQRRGNNQVMQSQVRALNALQADYLTSSAISNGNHKMALAYATNDFQSYLDGASAGSDSSGITYTNQLTQISLKPNEASIRINQVLIFKTRLSNEELAALTTI